MVERSVVRRRIGLVLGGALVGVAWTAGLHGADVHVVDWYLPLLCTAGAALVALRPVSDVRTVPVRMDHGAPMDRRPEMMALRNLEGQVARALREAGWYDSRLAPLLRDLARERARQRGHTDDDLSALLGEDAWRWLTTDRTRSRPPTAAELGMLIDRVEGLYRTP